jgi:uncharacterized protein (TIGR03083 family)
MECLGVNEYVTVLERDGHLLLSAAQTAGLDAPVPSCPGWLVRDLLAHIGFVHRWATGYVQQGFTEMVPEPDEPGVLVTAPPDHELLPWVAEGHASLVSALLSAPAGLQCWAFLAGAPSPLTFWARRQAHETAIHRVDTELAAGTGPSRLEAAFSADGVDEMLLGFLARPGSKRYTRVSPGAVSLEATDAGATWSINVSGTGIDTKRGQGASDLYVRGPAEDLYLLVWNRRTPAGLELDGRAELLDDWEKLFRVTWS